MVDYLTHNPKIWGPNPAIGTGRGKMAKKILLDITILLTGVLE